MYLAAWRGLVGDFRMAVRRFLLISARGILYVVDNFSRRAFEIYSDIKRRAINVTLRSSASPLVPYPFVIP